MAIANFKIKNITRGEGRSAVAATAYRSAEKITNNYDGVTYDFTRKKWILHKEIRLPDNAPREYFDRSTLWNAIESVEKSTTSQLASDILFALPIELSFEQQLELVREYVDSTFISTGMCADIAIHNPPVTNSNRQPIDKNGNPTKNVEEMIFRNPHVHILLTKRPMDKNGKWEKKTTTLYLAIKDGEEREFTPAEMKQAELDGWQKQYHYQIGDKKYWLPRSDARVQGIKSINNAPKQAKFGRQHPALAYWNNPDTVFEWRQKWVDHVNTKFIQYGIKATPLDARSYKDQGKVYEIPLHASKGNILMQKIYNDNVKKGVESDKIQVPTQIDILDDIRKHNQFVKEIQEKLEELTKQATEIIERFARQIELIRSKIINNHYLQYHYNKQKRLISETISDFADAVHQFESIKAKVLKANQQSTSIIANKELVLKNCSFYEHSKKEQLQMDILAEHQKINNRNLYLSDTLHHYNFSSEIDYEKKKALLQKQEEKITLHTYNIETLETDNSSLEAEYNILLSDIPKDYEQQFQIARMQIRKEYHSITTKNLQNNIGSPLELATYNHLAKEFDKAHDSSPSTETLLSPEKKHSKSHLSR
ncbi:MAG: MobA/MobL family protein [Lachnospiraceae bacterium]|nr:MobA/MobL family protein [Lachnospiraceae bacterium]